MTINLPVCPGQQCGALQDGAGVRLLHRGGPPVHRCRNRSTCAYILSTTMPMCEQSCGTLEALSEAPFCQLRISIYLHIDIDIDISAHNIVPPHEGCHDVFKIWYKDKWYNDVHQGPFPSLPCTDTFIFISML